jgi:Trk-type K+ transport system membrane component
MSQRTTPTAGPFRHGGLVTALDVLVALSAAGAVAALLLEYGFRRPPVPPHVLHVVEGGIVGLFVLDRLARLLLARRRGNYLRTHRLDFVLMALAAAAAVAAWVHPPAVSAGALYVLITQTYLGGALLSRGLGLHLRFTESGAHPAWLLLGSFAALSLVGSGLLMLPVAVPADAPTAAYVDALFTATSATCVTGLITRDTASDWSLFGQIVILALIQLGGLGIMLFGTMLAALAGRALSLRGSEAVGQTLGTERLGELRRTVVFVILVTLLLEAAGTAALYPLFDGARAAGGQTLWYSLFHSISSFCNAGFSLFSRNMMAGVGAPGPALRSRAGVLGVMAPLIVLGGLGFPVLRDCAAYVRGLLRRWLGGRPASGGARRPAARPRLTLHAKLVLVTTGVLLVVGMVGLLLVEDLRPRPLAQGTWPNLPPAVRLREAAFQSVTARTAGFNTIDMAGLGNSGKLWMCLLMTIGGSPASTAGGLKTATLAVLVLSTAALLRRRREVEAFGRSLPAELLRRALALAVLYLSLVAAVTLVLCVCLPARAFIDVLFEACSACGTVGLSTGITRSAGLAAAPKCVIIAGMYLGRVGPLTLLLALTSGLRAARYTYPREDVVIG